MKLRSPTERGPNEDQQRSDHTHGHQKLRPRGDEIHRLSVRSMNGEPRRGDERQHLAVL